MIFVKNARQSARRAPSASGSGTVLTVGSSDGWFPAEERAYTEDGAMKLSAVYACVTYLCDFISSPPVYVWNGDARQRVKAHGLNRILTTRPNDFQTPSALKRYLMRCALLRGNGYAYIDRAGNGKPQGLLPLSPDHMRVDLVENKPRYVYTVPRTGELFEIDPTDILHFPGDGNKVYKGKSVLRYAAETLHRATTADEYETAIYTNNATPSGILTTEADLSGESKATDADGKPISKKENIRRAWEKRHGGSNAFRIAVLDNGLKYQPIKIDAYDESFVLAKDVSIADIARFFGVPLHCLGAGKQSYSSNEQNSLEFIQGRGLAIVRAWEEELSYKLLLDSELESSLRVKFNLDGRLRGDTAARASFYKSMHEIGAYSVNDILSLEDKPDVPGGDVHYASLNYVPLEDFEELSRARNLTDKTMSTQE